MQNKQTSEWRDKKLDELYDALEFVTKVPSGVPLRILELANTLQNLLGDWQDGRDPLEAKSLPPSTE